jgi:4'-phosphopantetheinyl transferase
MTEVYAIKIMPEQVFLNIKERLLSLLPRVEREAMLRFKRVNVLQRSLSGEVMVRKILAGKLGTRPESFKFMKSEKGKPFLSGNPVHFNISHSGEYVVAAFCEDSEVGADVEKIKPVNFEIAERFYSESEKKELFSKKGNEKLEYFFDLWTMKESYLKLLGKGLTKPLSTFTISGANGRFHLSNDVDSIQSVHFKQFGIDKGYKLSVCSYNDDFKERIVFLNIEDLLS